MGYACPTCHRGALATRNVEPHEVLVAVPFQLTIPLNVPEEDTGFPLAAVSARICCFSS